MRDWHLRSKFENGVNVGGQIDVVWMFGIIGAFVLILACINFMNLSTARSERRAKEVGVRMTMGSVRMQLIYQFLSESFLVVLIAYLVAIVFTVASLRWFNDLAGKQISIPWTSPYFLLSSVVSILFTSLLAGSYPALFLSSFKPVKVLKGAFRVGKVGSIPRKVLVVVQFGVSVALAMGTVIVYQQIEFSQQRPVGYSREGLILIESTSADFVGKFDALKNELLKSNAIVEMAESSSPTYSTWSYNGGFMWEGMDPALEYSDFGTSWINPEYGKTIGWKIKEGRDFSRDFTADSSSLLVNETAAKFMGLTDPIGKQVTWDNRSYTIVGVVSDMITDSPYTNVKPNVWFVGYDDLSWINLRMNPSMSLQESLKLTKEVFNKIIPSTPFAPKFADDAYAAKFDAEVRIGKLVSVFAVLAIMISCLGIFGLASFVAQQRIKEIGVRKVLGASVASIWRMLSKDFVLLVLIASALALPAAVYFLNGWLSNYVYRTTITLWVPMIVVAGAFIVTLLTVSYQAIRAAKANPVDSLRSE
jgi:ABC-type antimicrobial peptide transport system permease subunit